MTTLMLLILFLAVMLWGWSMVRDELIARIFDIAEDDEAWETTVTSLAFGCAGIITLIL